MDIIVYSREKEGGHTGTLCGAQGLYHGQYCRWQPETGLSFLMASAREERLVPRWRTFSVMACLPRLIVPNLEDSLS